MVNMNSKAKRTILATLFGIWLSVTGCTTNAPPETHHAKKLGVDYSVQPEWTRSPPPNMGYGCASRAFYGAGVNRAALSMAKINLTKHKSSVAYEKVRLSSISVNQGKTRDIYDRFMEETTLGQLGYVTVIRSWTDPINGDVCLLIRGN